MTDPNVAATPPVSDAERHPNTETARPRAWIGDADGNRTPVPDDQIEGLEEFVEAWGRDVDFPEQLQFEAWQQADDDHPAGQGAPAYRIVFKTVRLITFPAVHLDAGNVQIVIGNGTVTTGEPRMVGALAERAPGSFLLPEWGRITTNDRGEIGYAAEPPPGIQIDNHEDVSPACNHVEIIYVVPDDTPASFAAQVAAGRAGVAPLLVELEMRFGPRLLGPTLAEEVGAMFDDGHWNRRLGGRLIRTETQASMEFLSGPSAAEVLHGMAEHRGSLNEEQLRRTRIASQWYLRGRSESDPTNSYIAFWLVLEALELGENINIAPLKRAVADLLAVGQHTVAARIGRLFGTRSKLVHGQLHAVTGEDVSTVEAIAAALLEHHLLGVVSDARATSLRSTLLTPTQHPPT